ncbi:hypothetical protein BC830DRAFT_869668 [Chytriomyces sp. MP71]|nr:hypothetical protein BC830DRAFT_869668 [Chytriomyces sp. MP71]
MRQTLEIWRGTGRGNYGCIRKTPGASPRKATLRSSANWEIFIRVCCFFFDQREERWLKILLVVVGSCPGRASPWGRQKERGGLEDKETQPNCEHSQPPPPPPPPPPTTTHHYQPSPSSTTREASANAPLFFSQSIRIRATPAAGSQYLFLRLCTSRCACGLLLSRFLLSKL